MRPQGVRITWDLVPEEVRERVAAQLGSRVVRAENQPGGFSPGAAARCVLADGRRCFIKAVSSQQNLDSPELHRQEAFVSTRLPAGLPVPKLRAVVDAEGWVVLVFDEIDGTPPPSPWTLPDLAATFVALDDLAAAATPCPVAGLPTFAERHVISFSYWRRLAEGDPVVDRVDPWSRTHLELPRDPRE